MQDEISLPPEEFVAQVVAADNLAPMLSDGQRTEIAQQVLADWRADKSSMADWFKRMKRGIDLANLVKDERDYPFQRAANVKYPLITEAALQFNARAYPALVPSERAVKARTFGQDAQGEKAARSERISEHMSYQLAAKVSEWEHQCDQMLVMLPIVGTMIRKWWWCPIEDRPKCRLIAPGKFIVNDNVTTLESAPRCTEEVDLYPYEVAERKRSGAFDPEFDLQVTSDDDETPQEFIEQHTRVDLDEDGYAEPYIATIHVETQALVRMVADFDERDVRYATERVAVPAIVQQEVAPGVYANVTVMQEQQIATGIMAIRRGTYFVAHHFMPGMDAGFWSTGLGLLLGDISDTINSLINMLLDAGHYATLGGGFIGRELRMKGGAQRMRPGEWRQVEVSGQDVRSAIVPLNAGGADGTLFQLLGMLIDSGRSIASIKDIMTGDAPRQNQTATATLALIEQGMMVFTAAYKRLFRSFKGEFALLADMNSRFLSPEEYNVFLDRVQPAQGEAGPQQEMFDPAQDYDLTDMDILPVADPQSVTQMQKLSRAQAVMQAAEMGIVNPQAAGLRFLEAIGVEDTEELMPQPDPMQQEMGMLSMQTARAELAEKSANVELTLAKVEEARASAIEAMAGAQSDQIRAANEVTKTRLDGLMAVLKDERERMAELLRSNARMEGKPGDGDASRSVGPGYRGPQAGFDGSLDGGPLGAGGGSQGPLDGGGVGRGLL